MATDKPRFSVSMTESMLEEVEKFRKANNIANKSKAVIRLAEIGLESLKKDALPRQGKASEIMDVYDSLDAHGKRMVEVVAAEEQARIDAARPAAKKPALAVVPPDAPAEEEPDYLHMPIAAYGPVAEEYTEEQLADIKTANRLVIEAEKKKGKLK